MCVIKRILVENKIHIRTNSEAKKLNPTRYWLGKKRSPETIKKMREKLKIIFKNFNLRERISKNHKGKHYSEKTEFKKGQFTKEKHPMWKGGKYKDFDGYWLILKPEHLNSNKQGYIRKSRLIVSTFLNRPLDRKEVIHHINEIKDDDRLENFYLFKKREHDKYHTILRYGNIKPIIYSNLI